MFLISLAVAALLFYGLVRLLEATALYYPTKALTYTPRDAGLKFEDVSFLTQDGEQLKGWFIPANGARRNLIYFHGNAGNMSDRVGKVAVFHSLGFNVLIFDYRGYGQSSGRPSENGLYQDGIAAADYLAVHPGAVGLPTVFYGTSLGGAVAIHTASVRAPAALVTEATFSNMKDMARIYYPFVPSFMLSLKFDSDRKMAGIQCPKLLLHSREDEIIPVWIGRKLFDAAAGPKEFVELAGGHNDNVFDERGNAGKALLGFLDKYAIN